MFQHYILFRGRPPQPIGKPGYRAIDDKVETDSEKAPLLHSSDGGTPTKEKESIQHEDCGAASLSKRFMRLLKPS